MTTGFMPTEVGCLLVTPATFILIRTQFPAFTRWRLSSSLAMVCLL